MSQENVEIVRESIEAYNRRDFDTAVRSFDTGIEWLLPPVLAAESRRGPEEIRRLWDTWIVSIDDEVILPPVEWFRASVSVARYVTQMHIPSPPDRLPSRLDDGRGAPGNPGSKARQRGLRNPRPAVVFHRPTVGLGFLRREAAKWREIEAIKHPLTGAKYGQLPT